MTDKGVSAREALCAICGYDPWDLPGEHGITADPLAWLIGHKNKCVDLWNAGHKLHKNEAAAIRAWEQSARAWEAKLRTGVGSVSRADLELLDRIGKHPPLPSLPEHNPYYKPIPSSMVVAATGETFAGYNHLLWRLDALLERVKEIEQHWRRGGISEEVVQAFYEPLYKALRADDWRAVGYDLSADKSDRIPARHWEFLRINEAGASNGEHKFVRLRFFKTPISAEAACHNWLENRMEQPKGKQRIVDLWTLYRADHPKPVSERCFRDIIKSLKKHSRAIDRTWLTGKKPL